MSILVPLDRLAATLTRFDHAYLLTVAPTGHVKVYSVDPHLDGGLLRIPGAGPNHSTNLARSAAVTVTWPPREFHGWTLIVDGTAQVLGDDVTVTPDHAILHRAAAHADGPGWVDPA